MKTNARKNFGFVVIQIIVIGITLVVCVVKAVQYFLFR